jgi:pheromone shutdown protein TraB
MTDSESQGRVRLVGTSHVSRESVREIEETIREERPDVVAVELDEGRYRQLKGDAPDDVDASDLLRGNSVFQLLAYWLLSYVQMQLGDRFDVEPGADMLAAIDLAEELDLDVALVDRDIQVTIRRFWSRMTRLEKVRLVGSLLVGIGDARVAGVLVGLVVGLVLGPVIGLFGGGLGVTDALLTRVTGGALLVAVVGAVVWVAGVPVLDDRTALSLSVGSLAAVLAGAAALGFADDFVVATVSPLVRRAVGSLTLGLAVGAAAGWGAGSIAARLGPDADGLGDVDELAAEHLTDAGVVDAMMDEFRTFSPGGAEALVDERDAYIARRLITLRASGLDVVAVVGAGHRDGIRRHLANPEAIPPRGSLDGVDRGRGPLALKLLGVLASAALLGFVALLALAGVRNGFLLRVFAAWFLVNGAFAAGLARLAGAHWHSALIGGALAWLTSVNPFLAPGWFTGYVELRRTPVNVGDVDVLNDLLREGDRPVGALVSDLFDVPLFRLAVIVAATNVGSIVASILFATYVLPLFARDLGGVDAVGRLLVDGAGTGAALLREGLARVAGVLPDVVVLVGGVIA